MEEKQRLMIKIAQLYYEGGLTQVEISKNLRLSRPRVSRLMQEAIKKGVVKISILQEPGSHTEIERLLEKKYNLLEAVVTDVPQPATTESIAREIGIVAADYFNRIVLDGDVIGLTWGATLASMVDNLHPEKKPNCFVLQMVGGLVGPKSETHATGLVSCVATALGSGMWLMPAPGVVDLAELARLLISDRTIAQSIERAAKVDIAFVGIGHPTQDLLLMRDGYIISWPEMESLIHQGAVGDIVLRYYDMNGLLIHSSLNDRVIGISLENFER